MIPKDAPKQDWSMYYNDTYMSHVIDGPCYISVSTSDTGAKHLIARRINTQAKLGPSKRVNAKDLCIMWPRPGAYNFPRQNMAGFIGRQPQRHMKRSAYRDHYYVLWAPAGVDGSYMMNQIAINCKYTTVEGFFAGLEKKIPVTSAALSNKVVLFKPQHHSAISVVYMAEEIGVLEDGVLVPHMPNDSRLPRIYRHLRTIGIT
jgi:hypothetical protein